MSPILFGRFLTRFPTVKTREGFGGFTYFYVGDLRIAETHSNRHQAHIFIDHPVVADAYRHVMTAGPFLS